MSTLHATPTTPRTERREVDRSKLLLPSWLGQRVGSPEEVARLKESLIHCTEQMAKLRSRNEQLMAVNSDLRCRLGEMTLKWVDACTRASR
jgi:hypothetical protein